MIKNLARKGCEKLDFLEASFVTRIHYKPMKMEI